MLIEMDLLAGERHDRNQQEAADRHLRKLADGSWNPGRTSRSTIGVLSSVIRPLSRNLRGRVGRPVPGRTPVRSPSARPARP